MSEVISIRFAEDIASRLRERASRAGESVSGLAQRLVDEGVRMDDHPGIVFRSGPAGRRAALAGGPDVWEVCDLVRRLDARGDDAVREASEWLGLPEHRVRAALRYYGEFPDEIDATVLSNEQAADRVRRALKNQNQLLG